MEMNEIIEGIKKENVFDFVSNNYHNMTKQQLAKLIKELDYIMYETFNEAKYDRKINLVIDRLED